MTYYNARMHPAEKALIIALKPFFIGSEFIEEENVLNLVVACKAFNYLAPSERIQMVYDILENCEYIEEDLIVIVQAYNQEELDELLETIL